MSRRKSRAKADNWQPRTSTQGQSGPRDPKRPALASLSGDLQPEQSEHSKRATQASDQRPPFNPLKFLWTTMGHVGGVLTLSSLAQIWTKDFLAWKGFVVAIIDLYRSLTEPVFDLLFGWLPFSVPVWVNDYLVLGGAFAISFRMHSYAERSNSIREWLRRLPGSLLFITTSYAFVALTWPLIVIYASVHGWRAYHYIPYHLVWRSMLLWFATMIAVALIFLSFAVV